MSDPRRKPRQGSDQLLLALVGVALILFGLVLIAGGFSDARQFAGYPLVLIGVLMLILRAFHRRLRLVKLFNKIELALTPEAANDPEADRRTSEPPVRQHEAHAPSLREVSRAAKNPDTERHRRD